MRSRPDVCSALLAASVLLLLALPSAAPAQEATHRGGFWLSGGIGTGFDEEIDFGGSGFLRLGGTLGSNFLLGGQLTGFAKGASVTVTDPDDPTDVDRVDATRSKSSLTATVLAYPSATGSFFFRAGLGVGSQEVSAEIEGLEVSASEDFVAMDLGLGHDFHLGGGNLYLTPEVAAMLHAPDAEISATDATFLVVVGIGFR